MSYKAKSRSTSRTLHRLFYFGGALPLMAAAFAYAASPFSPALSYMNPVQGVVGQTQRVEVVGDNFMPVTTFSLGPGISVSALRVVNKQIATMTVTISASAAPGSRDLTAWTGRVSSTLPRAFAVRPRPSPSSPPNSAVPGPTTPNTGAPGGTRPPVPGASSPSVATNPYFAQQAVQVTIDRLTGSGDVVVPPQCSGNVVISCSAGKPMMSEIRVTRNSLTISPAGTNAYSFSALIAALTPAEIPITYAGFSCGLDINTNRSSPFSVTGTLNVSGLPTPNVYKVTLANVRVSSSQGAIQFNGGAACGIANALQGLAQNSVLPQALESRSGNPACVAVDTAPAGRIVKCPL